ncbi:hypothetical protein AMAG_19625 [Allomyces macrogynus ATCC 38327]|uniref:NmrA-like domain-containing protein n=1 Tax=Allomyces macrogynus (strain ATCC 38327) TaxID=578462 RepID=A0A0L0SY05_ALLM3|nr:hypothetical protein AMAG_19623 [Allomyces macrogynus ATCC 38327]KNE67382.1 hypothetical protein AMAG_19625 [Allomyces macrogynus ATCC 38327]|eukprot:KNE67379.1 hypothetical protein AMAG_19623 [Allomyces macrogynus ATCC 38327]
MFGSMFGSTTTTTTRGKVFVTEGDAWVGFYAAYSLIKQGQFTKVLVGVRKDRRRDSDLIQQLESMGAEIIEYDPTSATGNWTQHLAGVQSMVLVPVHDVHKMAEYSINVLKAADREQACKHLVLWSCLGAGLVQGAGGQGKDEAIFRQFYEIEQAVRACQQLDQWVTLRLGFLMQQFFALSSVMQNRGLFPLTSKTGKLAPVNLKDIGHATAMLLADPNNIKKDHGQTLILTGTRAVSGPQLVEIANQTLDAQIQFQEVSVDQMREILGKNDKVDEADLCIFMGYLCLLKANKLDIVTKDLTNLIGRDPADIKAFFKENRDSFRPHRSHMDARVMREVTRSQ